MQAILITFDQAHYEKIVDMLERLNCRGYTAWPLVNGRGSNGGEPHLGSHAWPSLASAIITVVEDNRAAAVMERLRLMDEERPKLGLRAFQWPVTATV